MCCVVLLCDIYIKVMENHHFCEVMFQTISFINVIFTEFTNKTITPQKQVFKHLGSNQCKLCNICC